MQPRDDTLMLTLMPTSVTGSGHTYMWFRSSMLVFPEPSLSADFAASYSTIFESFAGLRRQ